MSQGFRLPPVAVRDRDDVAIVEMLLVSDKDYDHLYLHVGKSKIRIQIANGKAAMIYQVGAQPSNIVTLGNKE